MVDIRSDFGRGFFCVLQGFDAFLPGGKRVQDLAGASSDVACPPEAHVFNVHFSAWSYWNVLEILKDEYQWELYIIVGISSKGIVRQ